MLTLASDLHAAILAHARADHPREACGAVVGPAGSGRAVRLVRLPNAAPSTVLHEVPSADLLTLYRAMDERGEEPVVLYHSHTASPAYPSALDVEYAGEPGAHHVIVSTAVAGDDGSPSFRSFRIVDGRVTEEDVEVVPSSPAPDPTA